MLSWGNVKKVGYKEKSNAEIMEELEAKWIETLKQHGRVGDQRLWKSLYKVSKTKANSICKEIRGVTPNVRVKQIVKKAFAEVVIYQGDSIVTNTIKRSLRRTGSPLNDRELELLVRNSGLLQFKSYTMLNTEYWATNGKSMEERLFDIIAERFKYA